MLLRAVALPYGGVVRIRNLLYDRGVLRSRGATVSSICVGNLTTGGTGKTPVVAWLAEAAGRAGRRPAILTRGYAPSGGVAESDEVLLYGRLVPDVPVVVDGDRVRGAATAVAAGADLLLLDDGFQHRRFVRGVDIVLLDARDPFGGGKLLPAGRLREPPSGLARAAAIVLTRCGRASAAELAATERTIRPFAPDTPLLREDHVVSLVVGSDGRTPLPLEGARVLVFSGIADGRALAESVRGLGATPLRVLDYGDHHAFTPAEVRGLEAEAAALGASAAVTTEKDLVRLTGAATWKGDVPLVAPRVVPSFSEADRGVLGGIVGFELPAVVG